MTTREIERALCAPDPGIDETRLSEAVARASCSVWQDSQDAANPWSRVNIERSEAERQGKARDGSVVSNALFLFFIFAVFWAVIVATFTPIPLPTVREVNTVSAPGYDPVTQTTWGGE